MISGRESDILTNTVDEALGLAAVDRVADGYCERGYTLEQAQAAREDGEEWAVALVPRYRIALDNYCESYGVRIG